METLPLLTAKIFASFYFLLGLSCIVRPKAWLEFVLEMKARKYGFLGFALIALPFGLFILNTHQLWSWTPTVFVTIAGWSMVIKYTIYILFPHWWPSALIPSTESGLERYFKISGYFIFLIGLALMYYTYIDISPLYMGGRY